MPYKDKAIERAYRRKRYAENREEHLAKIKARRLKNPQAYKDIANRAAKKYRQTEKGKRATLKGSQKVWKEQNHKYRARQWVSRAIKSGKLIRPELCSTNTLECSGRIEGHHPDYTKPLEVIWLCEHHHKLIDYKEK